MLLQSAPHLLASILLSVMSSFRTLPLRKALPCSSEGLVWSLKSLGPALYRIMSSKAISLSRLETLPQAFLASLSHTRGKPHTLLCLKVLCLPGTSSGLKMQHCGKYTRSQPWLLLIYHTVAQQQAPSCPKLISARFTCFIRRMCKPNKSFLGTFH